MNIDNLFSHNSSLKSIYLYYITQKNPSIKMMAGIEAAGALVGDLIEGVSASAGNAARGLAQGAVDTGRAAVGDAAAVARGTATSAQTINTFKNAGQVGMVADQAYNTFRPGQQKVNKAGDPNSIVNPPVGPGGKSAAGRFGANGGGQLLKDMRQQDASAKQNEIHQNAISGSNQEISQETNQMPYPVAAPYDNGEGFGEPKGGIYGDSSGGTKSSYQGLMDAWSSVKKVAVKAAAYAQKARQISQAIHQAKESGDYSKVMSFLPSSLEGAGKSFNEAKSFASDAYKTGKEGYEYGKKAVKKGKEYLEVGKKYQKEAGEAWGEAKTAYTDVKELIGVGKKSYAEGKQLALTAKENVGDAYSTVKSINRKDFSSPENLEAKANAVLEAVTVAAESGAKVAEWADTTMTTVEQRLTEVKKNDEHITGGQDVAGNMPALMYKPEAQRKEAQNEFMDPPGAAPTPPGGPSASSATSAPAPPGGPPGGDSGGAGEEQGSLPDDIVRQAGDALQELQQGNFGDRSRNLPPVMKEAAVDLARETTKAVSSMGNDIAMTFAPNQDGSPAWGGADVGSSSLDIDGQGLPQIFHMDLYRLILSDNKSSTKRLNACKHAWKLVDNSFKGLTVNTDTNTLHALRFRLMKAHRMIKTMRRKGGKQWNNVLLTFPDTTPCYAIAGAMVSTLMLDRPEDSTASPENIFIQLPPESLIALSSLYLNSLMVKRMDVMAQSIADNMDPDLAEQFMPVWGRVFSGMLQPLYEDGFDSVVAAVRSGQAGLSVYHSFMKATQSSAGLFDALDMFDSMGSMGMSGSHSDGDASIGGISNITGAAGSAVSSSLVSGNSSIGGGGHSLGIGPGAGQNALTNAENTTGQISIPAMSKHAFGNEPSGGAIDKSTDNSGMASEAEEGVSYNPAQLVDQGDCITRLMTIVGQINDYTVSSEFMEFMHVLQSKESLKLDGPEEEHNNQLFDMDVSMSEDREDVGSSLDGILDEITANVDLLMMTLEHIQVLVNTSLEYSDGEVQRNHHKAKTKKISAEREERANRKHLRAIVNSSELTGKMRRPFVTGKIVKAKDVVPAFVGKVLRVAFRIARNEKKKAGQTAGGSFMSNSAGESYGSAFNIQRSKQEDKSRMNEVRRQWDSVVEYMINISGCVKKCIHTAHVTGAGQLIGTNLTVGLMDLLRGLRSASLFSSSDAFDTIVNPNSGDTYVGGGGLGGASGGSGSGGAPDTNRLSGKDPAKKDEDPEAIARAMAAFTGGAAPNAQPSQTFQLRPTFLDVGGDVLRKTREDLILSELLWNSFDYVPPNGYLGERNKIHRDNVRNQMLQNKAPLYGGRTWEPNHGLYPLDQRLQTNLGKPYCEGSIKRMKKKIAAKKRGSKRKMMGKEILPGDLNVMPSQLGLPYMKPSPMRFTRDNQFQLAPYRLPDGRTLDRQKMRKVRTETWNFPWQASQAHKPHRVPLKSKMAQYYTHFSGTANY